MSEIPIIDVSPFRSGGPGDRRKVANDVDAALREIGFFCLTGHGIDWGEVEDTCEVCQRFFELPADTRRAVANQGKPFRGYMGVGDENLSFTENKPTPPDWKEFFSMGRIDRDDPYFHRADVAYTYKENIWPAQQPELRQAMERYYRAMEKLNDETMQILAVALDLEPDFFKDKFNRHDNTLRAANYPHQANQPAAGQLRAGAHTDYGSLTLLKIDDAPGGLQVRSRSGEWVTAPQPQQGFIVNIGDLIMTWTNDRWLSNLHRVVNPPEDFAGSTQRLSLVYFANCNPDTLIECLPTCTDASHPPLHPPVRAGEHRMMKLNKSAENPLAELSAVRPA